MVPINVPALAFQLSMTPKTAADARPGKIAAVHKLE
jgi:hypothetical protein